MAIYTFDKIAINSTQKVKPLESDKEHYIGLEHIDPECLYITRWGADAAPIGEKLVMKKGDILFGKRRAYQRKVGIAPFDGIFSAHGLVLRPKEDVIIKEFFPFFISSDQFLDRAVQISVGGLSPTVNWSDLARQEFDLPSIEEQKVLADKLWAAYKVKESYRQLLSTTDEMLKAKFQEMFGKEPTMTLGQLAESWSKGQAFKKDEITETGKTPCIHYGQLYQYGAVIENILSFTDADAVRTSKIGDILFPASDVTPKGLARCSCINKDGVILGGDIIIMHPLEGLNSSYLSYAINQQTQQLLALVTGSVVRHMSAKSLQTVRIPVPEKEDQQQFAEIATQAEATKASLRASIEAIDRVIRSLINQ